jgi:hypothetical protein
MVTLSDSYTQLTNKLKGFGASLNVTYYALSLGDANATTGQYAKEWAEGATIEMPIVSRAAQQLLTGTGIHVRAEVEGFTKSTVAEGDEIKDASGRYYRVDWVRSHYVGDTLVYHEVALTYLPLHEA